METLHERHLVWWKKFWSVSEISLDDPVIEQRYYLSKYMLASVSRDPEYPPNILGISTFLTVRHGMEIIRLIITISLPI